MYFLITLKCVALPPASSPSRAFCVRGGAERAACQLLTTHMHATCSELHPTLVSVTILGYLLQSGFHIRAAKKEKGEFFILYPLTALKRALEKAWRRVSPRMAGSHCVALLY